MATALTKDEIREEMLATLGDTKMFVELDKERHIDRSINRAVRTFRRFLVKRACVVQRDVTDTQAFTLPTGAIGIVDFDYVATEDPPASEQYLDIFNIEARRVRPRIRSGELYSLAEEFER